MNQNRIQRATSEDGTEIAARVHGQGPPVVFLHAGLGDGELDWGAALPWLEERFSCYLMSYRSRGLSGESSARTPDRLVQDIVALAESIGEPVGLVGPSGGGMFTLAAAAHSDAVSAVATYEPIVFEALGEEEGAAFQEAFELMDRTAAEGRLVDACREWIDFFCYDDEMAALSKSEYFEAASRYVPNLLEEIRQALAYEGPGPTDPTVLAEVEVPVLLLQGTRSLLDWYPDGVRHVAEHVADPHVREVEGGAHMAPWVEPEAVVEQLARFFEEAFQPV